MRGGLIFLFVCLLITFFSIHGFFNDKKSGLIRIYDKGYYSGLPAIFIYGDFDAKNASKRIQRYYLNRDIPYLRFLEEEKVSEEHFCGRALMIYPFFMTAHLLTLHFNLPADGYSILYQYFFGLAFVAYGFIGIFFCARLFKLYGASTSQSLIACVLLFFATSLYYFSSVETGITGIFSFAAIAAFLFFVKAVMIQKKKKFIIAAIFFLGLIGIIRPSDLLILLSIPFLAGDWKTLIDSSKFVFRNAGYTIAGILSALFLFLIQILAWKAQTGEYLVKAFISEQIPGLNPDMKNMLFGFQSGIFIYTPIVLLSMSGFIYLFRKNKYEAISLLIFLFVTAFVYSCYRLHTTTSAIGFTALIRFFPIIGLLLLFSLRLLNRKWLRFGFAVICVFLVYVTQAQAYQYRNFILHHERMSEYKYRQIFLKTADRWMGFVYENLEPSDLDGKPLLTKERNFDSPEDGWSGGAIEEVGAEAHSGSFVSKLDPTATFSNTLTVTDNSILAQSKKPALAITGYLKDQNSRESKKLQFVISYDNSDGGTYFYKSRFVDNFTEKKNGWKKFEIALNIQPANSPSDKMKIYFWSAEAEKFFLDDIKLEFVELEK